MSLQSDVGRVVRAGGSRMPPAKRQSLFPGDSRKTKNLVAIAENAVAMKAVKAKVVSDHRVIGELFAAGPVLARIVLSLETKLGRKLPRSRAQALVASYRKVRAANASAIKAEAFIRSMNEQASRLVTT